MSSVSDELLKEIAGDREEAGGQSIPTYKVLGDGKPHKIRVLPGTYGKSKKRWYEPLCQHWGPIPGKNRSGSFICRKEHFGKPCSYCEAWAAAKDDEVSLKEELQSADSKEERNRISAKLKLVESIIKNTSFRRTYLHEVINREERTPITRVYFAPKTVWESFVTAFTNNSETDLMCPKTGHDFYITRSTKEGRTEYETSVELKQSPLSKDESEIDRLLEGRHDLKAEYVVDLTDDEIDMMKQSVELILSGKVKTAFKESKDDDLRPRNRDDRQRSRDDDEPAPRKRKPVEDDDDDIDLSPRKPRKTVADEDDDDLRPRKRKPVEDDDDDIDLSPRKPRKTVADDDDDDLDLSPSPRNKSKSNDELLRQFEDDDED